MYKKETLKKKGGQMGISLQYSRVGEQVTIMDVLNLKVITGIVVYEKLF